MGVPFSNEPMPADELPRLADDAFVSVDPRYLQASLVGYLVTTLVVVVGTAAIATQAEQPVVPLAIGGGILALVLLGVCLRVLEVRRLGYQLREHDLSLRSGVITHRVESLPFTRVQHVNINRGPIERALGLATLEVSSAGPNITIPGLTEAVAARIKLLVTERAGVDDIDDTSDLSDLNDHLAPPTGPTSASK